MLFIYKNGLLFASAFVNDWIWQGVTSKP